jgi:DNA-binding NtrC family response regulator
MILIVDDDAMICRALQAKLEKRGYRVTTAHDVDSALRKIEAGETYDIVLADHFLRQRMGNEVLVEVEKRMPHAKRILMSGGPVPLEKKAESCAQVFMIKPLDLSELWEVLGAPPSQ